MVAQGGGVILRPGATPLKCAKGGDSGGHCLGSWCPPLTALQGELPVSLVKGLDYPGDGCGVGKAWRLEDTGAYLQRQAAWQVLYNRLEHNEFIVDATAWDDALPDLIQAFFVSSTATVEAYRTKRVREAFMKLYGVKVPLVTLDLNDWYEPFSAYKETGGAELVLTG